MSIGEIIRKRREEMSLTQDTVASSVGISKPYLSNIETDKVKNPPTDRVLGALERSLQFEQGQLTRLAHMVRTPADVREEHELLEAQVQKLRSVLKEMLAKAPRQKLGGVDLDALAAEVGPQGNVAGLTPGIAVPVINKVAAGYPRQFTDLDYPPSVADEYIRCPDLHDSQAFAARVVGDSMAPEFREGDVVVFSPNSPVRSGDDCFVRFAEDAATTFKRFYQDAADRIRLQPLNNEYPSETFRPEEITGLWRAVYRIQRLGSR
jgi:SOS-response transcriptional repressor LexA